MSRYTVKSNDGNLIVYGYDFRVMEFFMTEYTDTGKGKDLTKRGEILDYLENHSASVPKSHKDALALDLPF